MYYIKENINLKEENLQLFKSLTYFNVYFIMATAIHTQSCICLLMKKWYP